jgi:CheY-like chemotaxis protein
VEVYRTSAGRQRAREECNGPTDVVESLIAQRSVSSPVSRASRLTAYDSNRSCPALLRHSLLRLAKISARRSLQRLLSLSCDAIATAPDCSCLLDRAKRRQPDIVLPDLNLPGGDSLMACEEITHAPSPHPAIVLTGGLDPQPLPSMSSRRCLRIHRQAHGCQRTAVGIGPARRRSRLVREVISGVIFTSR